MTDYKGPSKGTKGAYYKKPNTWVNSRIAKQNKKMVREANAASRSRGLIKARLTALTAKVSLMESEILSIMEALNIKGDTQVVVARKEIQTKLLQTAEALGSLETEEE